jgi:hypothetical protein
MLLWYFLCTVIFMTICVCKVLRTTFAITWPRRGDCSSVMSSTLLFWICRVFRTTCAMHTTVSLIPLVYSYFKYSQRCVWRSCYEIHHHCGSIIIQFSTHFFLCYFAFCFLFSLPYLLHHFLFISLYLLFLFLSLGVGIIWEPVSWLVVSLFSFSW